MNKVFNLCTHLNITFIIQDFGQKCDERGSIDWATVQTHFNEKRKKKRFSDETALLLDVRLKDLRIKNFEYA
jgi:hypothetical protein